MYNDFNKQLKKGEIKMGKYQDEFVSTYNSRRSLERERSSRALQKTILDEASQVDFKKTFSTFHVTRYDSGRYVLQCRERYAAPTWQGNKHDNVATEHVVGQNKKKYENALAALDHCTKFLLYAGKINQTHQFKSKPEVFVDLEFLSNFSFEEDLSCLEQNRTTCKPWEIQSLAAVKQVLQSSIECVESWSATLEPKKYNKAKHDTLLKRAKLLLEKIESNEFDLNPFMDEFRVKVRTR